MKYTVRKMELHSSCIPGLVIAYASLKWKVYDVIRFLHQTHKMTI
jgi:hypothetical protein